MSKSLKFVSITAFFIMLDQCIKLYIKLFSMNNNRNIIGEYVKFQPYLNVDFSWVNSLFDLGIGRYLHIILMLIIILLISLIFRFISSIKKGDKLVDLLFLLIYSGAICSLIDKVFWGGSLDYIALKGLFIFDLKDFYITMFEIILVSMFLFNYRGLRKFKDKELFNNFKRFIKSGFKQDFNIEN